jgi:FkbM family methyltransferase
MSFSIKLGNFLYKNVFWLYRPMYAAFKGRQDRFEIELLKKHLKPGDVVLDIGANIGYYAELISKLVGEKGRVHCFEPDAINFKHLQNNCGSISNLVLNNKAVGPKTEKLKIYTSKNLNVDHRTYEPEDYDEALEIDAVSVDDYLTGKEQKVQLIKMDIQGFEMQAVQGMKDTLINNPGIKIISEFWPYGLRKAGSSALAYFEFLTQNGFTVQLLKNKSLETLNEEKVKALNDLGEKTYFNILAQRTHV